MAPYAAALVLSFACAAAHSDEGSFVSFDFQPVGETREFRVTEGVAKPYTVVSQTYHSQAFSMKPGQMLFTSPWKTPIPVPGNGKDCAVLGMLGDIAKDGPDGTLVPAPLSEVYDHHYIMEEASHRNLLCQGGPNYMFGIGSESRDSPEIFPKGHGYMVKAGAEWGANIHLLRTDAGKYLKGDDPHAAIQQCNECWYAPGKGAGCTPELNGTFNCCGEDCYDGSCFCPLKPFAKLAKANNYYLRYQVNYTYDIDSIQGIDVGVYTTPNCETFYSVMHNDEQPETVASTTFTVPANAELMLLIGHQHVGGRNISVYHNDKFLCASYGRYGTEEGVPGNEKGYLVQMTTCYNADENGGQGYPVKKGDKLRIDSWYWVGTNDEKLAPNPGGTHLNVMGYMYTAYKVAAGETWDVPTGAAPTAGCKEAINRYCGQTVGFTDVCMKCAHEHSKELSQATCESEAVQGVCSNIFPRSHEMHTVV